MSFRELRNFCEIMRSLGYPRPVSMENFKLPNFELVSDILYWFVLRYDPETYIQYEIEAESDRVVFIKSVVQMFASKARIKLNPKKIYQSDGYAVKEMLKIATMLNKAMKASAAAEDDEIGATMDLNMDSKLSNLKAARSLANEITETGAKLFDSLGKEGELRSARTKALEFLDSISGNLDSNTDYIEKCIRDLMGNQDEQITQMQEMVGKLKQSESQLESKIERRSAELERAKKRLQGISSVRPEHLDEYEKLEEELERFYVVYVEKFKNLDYLEHQLDEYNNEEMTKKEESERELKKIQQKFMQEENKDQGIIGGDGERNQMGTTGTGFHPGKRVEGTLNDDDSDEEDIEVSDDDEDDEGGLIVGSDEDDDGIEEDDDDDEGIQEDDEDGDDHNF